MSPKARWLSRLKAWLGWAMDGEQVGAQQQQPLDGSSRERELVTKRPRNSPDPCERVRDPERQRLEEWERRWNTPNEENRRRQIEQGVFTMAPVVPPPPARPIDTQLWSIMKDQRIARAISRQWPGLPGEEMITFVDDTLRWASWFETPTDREAKDAKKRREFVNNGWHESVDHS